MKLVFSGLARADVRNIALYTANIFGPRQAKRYVSEIETRCHELAAGHLHGQNADILSQDLRKLRVLAHIIFFRCDDGANELTVVRVLHASMDHESRLRNL